MIQLPPLEITRDEFREVELYTKFRKALLQQDETRPVGIHASGLLDPRRTYWQEALPKDITERQVYFFIIGKVLHSLILQTDGQSDLGSHEALGVFYSPDGRTEAENPVEVKTSRSNYEPREGSLQEDLGHYLEQLACYLVLDNRLEGELWVLYLNLKNTANRTFPELRCYKVILTEEQFYDIDQRVLEARDALAHAREEHDPSQLPLCRQWLCSPDACAWWSECQPPGRFPEVNKKRWTA